MAAVDDWKAKRKEVLVARVTHNISLAAVDSKLTGMDTDWGLMSAGEKTTQAANLASCNVSGAQTRVTLAYDGTEAPKFPKACIIHYTMFDDLVARYT